MYMKKNKFKNSYPLTQVPYSLFNIFDFTNTKYSSFPVVQ
ncbi:hypothetical protein SDC9_106486 [bioreactor metagenome]|uniref:Uncharacterized protein n=1 Tax=bioreactor metagenome TaxID=1076179 RepID=A0A645B2F5_9ZZZZ